MSISLVPGFAQRYPKEDDDPLLPSGENRQTQPDRVSQSCSGRSSLLVESCCTTMEEALSAEARGAGRIELCTNLSVGGLTPPRDLITEVVSRLSIPVNVLIRPSSHESTGGIASGMGFTAADFVYDEAGLQQMISDIEFCKSAGIAGIVIGALTPEGAIDMPAMRRLVAAARPLPVTFHRAFDVCTQDPFIALDLIISLGCARLLSSGHAPTAWDGRMQLFLLVRRAGRRLIVMPGCGVTPGNIKELAGATGASEIHGTRIP